MATTRLIPMHQNKGKTISQCLNQRTEYAVNPEKTGGGEYVTSYACDPQTIELDFMLTKKDYQYNTGRTQSSNVIAYQIRQSFKPNEVTPEDANKIGYELAMKFTKGNHAFVVATHTDKAHIHNHIIFNSTSTDGTKKFRNFMGSSFAIRKISDRLCLENNLSIVENPKDAQGHYGKWLGDEKPKSQRQALEQTIDFVMSKSPTDIDDFLRRMRDAGYEVKQGKYLAFRPQEAQRFIRLRSLGEDYSDQKIIARICEKDGNPTVKEPSTTVNMLIDIQAKLQEGKGSGYEQWAKIFNIKQMSNALCYLTENDLLDYNKLNDMAVNTTAIFHQAQEKIQLLDTQMNDINTLQKHIVCYYSTREIFSSYRKSGYSKKFLADNQEAIASHRAAKKYFNQQDLKKLPSIQSLKKQYADLLQEKKSACKASRQAKDEMKEIVIAKANIDTLLEKDSAKHRTNPTAYRR